MLLKTKNTSLALLAMVACPNLTGTWHCDKTARTEAEDWTISQRAGSQKIHYRMDDHKLESGKMMTVFWDAPSEDRQNGDLQLVSCPNENMLYWDYFASENDPGGMEFFVQFKRISDQEIEYTQGGSMGGAYDAKSVRCQKK